MILLLLPVFSALLTGFLMLPMVILVLAFKVGSEAWIGWSVYPCAGLALVLGALIFRRRLWWRIRLEGDQLVLGRGFLARRVPCERVTLIQAGEAGPSGRRKRPRWAEDPDSKHRTDEELYGPRHLTGGADAVVPLTLEISWIQHLRVHLRRAAADHCLQTLRQHCRAALAIDSHGTEYMPDDPRHLPAARQRLAKLLLTGGLVALVVGTLGVVLCGTVFVAMARGQQDWSDSVELVEILLGSLAAMGGGWYSARRAWRLIR